MSTPPEPCGLEGLRVVELGEGVSAAWATKWLADLGADVIKVEGPGGDALRRRGPFAGPQDPERAGFFHYLNANKRGIVFDLTTADGRRELDALVSTSDALIHNLPARRVDAWELHWERLRERTPSLVLCSITAFGLTGPRRGWCAEELTVAHAGGWGWLSPGASKELDRPPLKAFGHQADLQGGTTAATATLAAVYRARRTGAGEHVDLSVQAVVASILEAGLVYYTYPGLVATRFGERGLNPWGIYECRDGRIFLCTVEDDQWQRLVDFMGRPDWAELPIFAGFPQRFQNADALHVFIQEWVAPWKVRDLFHEGQRRRICFAPVHEMSELSEQEHLRERGFLVEMPVGERRVRVPGAPYRLADPWWELRRPAPRLGEHQREIDAELVAASAPRTIGPDLPVGSGPDPLVGSGDPPVGSRPLDGIRVADFSWVWAGPYCALQLAHLGADVIKVESRERPDLGRRLPVYPPDVEPGLNRSGYFNQWGQGKRSFGLDLSRPGAIDLAKRLVAECDVAIENFATGVMDRLGLGWEVLRQINPRLVMASLSGYGQTGPWRSYMAYGPATPPLAGLSALTGYRGGAPREVGISIGDPAAGITAAAGICAALVARERSGRGQYLDVSLWEATAILTGEGWLAHELTGHAPPRIGNRDPWMAPHGCYRCAGADAWVSIACAGEAEWRALCSVIDPALAGDARFASRADRKRCEDALDEVLSAWTAERDPWEVSEALQAVGVAAFPSLSTEQLCRDPQLEARGFFARLEHPEVGVRQHAGIPWRLDEADNGVRAPAPLLGADTDDVLRDVLGCAENEIAALRESKVVC